MREVLPFDELKRSDSVADQHIALPDTGLRALHHDYRHHGEEQRGTSAAPVPMTAESFCCRN